MLQKSKSKPISKFKFLIVLPLLAAMLTYVSCSSTQSQNRGDAAQETPGPPPPPPAPSAAIAEKQKDIDPNLPIPFTVVEQVPVFPGCEELKTVEEQKNCMSEKINMYVNRNFNTNLGKELGLTGINRIYVQFKVSKGGEVTDVRSRAPHPDLGAEAERVVNNLPGMDPAIHGGKEVAILYSLPITFRVAEPEPTEEGKEGDQN